MVRINRITQAVQCEEARKWHHSIRDEYIKRDGIYTIFYLKNKSRRDAANCAKEMLETIRYTVEDKINLNKI